MNLAFFRALTDPGTEPEDSQFAQCLIVENCSSFCCTLHENRDQIGHVRSQSELFKSVGWTDARKDMEHLEFSCCFP